MPYRGVGGGIPGRGSVEVLYGTGGSVSVNTLGTNGSVLPAPPEPSTPSSRLCSPTSPLLPLGRTSLTSPSSPAVPGPARLARPTPRTAETGTAVTPAGSVASALAGQCCPSPATQESGDGAGTGGRAGDRPGPASRCQPRGSASGTPGAHHLQERTQSEAGPRKGSAGLVPRSAWETEARLSLQWFSQVHPWAIHRWVLCPRG